MISTLYTVYNVEQEIQAYKYGHAQIPARSFAEAETRESRT
jgi:hypothetical protein